MKQRVSNPVIIQGSMPKYHCIVCKKAIEAFYGSWGDSGTCGRACERTQESKTRFPTSEELKCAATT